MSLHPKYMPSKKSDEYPPKTSPLRQIFGCITNRRTVASLIIICGVYFLFFRETYDIATRDLEVDYEDPPLDVNESELLVDPTVAQDDPRLVAAVRRMLIPPSTEPYNFVNPELADPQKNLDPSAGQSQAVKDILEGFGSDGFFIECGANDGESISNTLWVERNLGWKGVLIEADPRALEKLLQKNRKAYIGKFCVSNKPNPQFVPFYMDDADAAFRSGLIASEQYHATQIMMVQCIPLYTVILALGRKTIDFFSLDVEGSEIEILQTLPQDVIFKVVTITHDALREGKLGLRKFMEDRGYIFYRTVSDAQFAAGDSIFVHKSVQLTEAQLEILGTDNDNFQRPPRN